MHSGWKSAKRKRPIRLVTLNNVPTERDDLRKGTRLMQLDMLVLSKMDVYVPSTPSTVTDHVTRLRIIEEGKVTAREWAVYDTSARNHKLIVGSKEGYTNDTLVSYEVPIVPYRSE